MSLIAPLPGVDMTSLWSLVIQIATISGSLIVVGSLIVKITRHITKVEERITNEATRLDGRINQLQDRSDIVMKDIYLQREEISKLKDYLLNNAQLLVKISEMSERGKNNVESDRTRKEKD